MNIYFCHIWKTGGLSLQEVLKESFGEAACFNILPFIADNDKYKQSKNKIIYGHSLYSLETVMKESIIYTILREPVSRIISYWKHIVREDQKTLLRPFYNKNLKDIFTNPLFINFCCNLQTKILGLDIDFSLFFTENKNSKLTLGVLGKLYDNMLWRDVFLVPCTEKIYQKAKKRLDKISYGIFEFYDSEVKQFLYSLGIERKTLPYINKSENQNTIFDSKEAKEMLYSMNEYDVRLYNYAKKRKGL